MNTHTRHDNTYTNDKHYYRIEIACPVCGDIKLSAKGGYRKDGSKGPGLESKGNAEQSATKSVFNKIRACDCTRDTSKWTEFPDFLMEGGVPFFESIMDYILRNTREAMLSRQGNDFHWRRAFRRDDDDVAGTPGVVA